MKVTGNIERGEYAYSSSYNVTVMSVWHFWCSGMERFQDVSRQLALAPPAEPQARALEPGGLCRGSAQKGQQHPGRTEAAPAPQPLSLAAQPAGGRGAPAPRRSAGEAERQSLPLLLPSPEQPCPRTPSVHEPPGSAQAAALAAGLWPALPGTRTHRAEALFWKTVAF